MKVGVVEAFAHTAMVVNGTSRTSQPHPRLSAIGVTAHIGWDSRETARSRMTHERH
jgi:hypothetical protein